MDNHHQSPITFSMWLHRFNSPTRLVVVAGILSLAYYFSFSRLAPQWHNPGRDQSRSDISNATLGFQKLFVINMPSRTDRRDAVDLAASTTDIKFDFIDGVAGDSIPEFAFPPGGSSKSIKLSKGIKGSWRSHMNVLNKIVHENLTTAVIFEDDMDWDIRLRDQLHRFAQASRFLTSNSNDVSKYPIEQLPNPESEQSIHNNTSPHPYSPILHSLPLSDIPPSPETQYPYGDPANWDVLWLGHCGVGFPRGPESEFISANQNNLVLMEHDDSVPAQKHLRAHPFGPLDALSTSYSPHTRVYHTASGGALCTVAYAVSQRGARRLLHEYSVKGWRRIWDNELGMWCAGSDEERERKCITSQPPVFGHHHPKGGESDIGGLGGGYARTVETRYVRWSVRMNLEKLIWGEGRDGVGLVDGWPD